MSPRPTHRPPLAIGYARVSTSEQHGSGAGLAAQEATIRAEAERRGWELLAIVGEPDGASSATLERPGLQSVMARLDAGDADVLVVSKLDRLSRSTIQGGMVLERAQRKGWSVVALDFGLDMTTPAGEMVANVILSTSQYERRMIGVRTREALAVKRAQGVRFGGPQVLPQSVVERIVRERRAGAGLRVIAEGLQADGIPAARGGARRTSSVDSVLRWQAAASIPQ